MFKAGLISDSNLISLLLVTNLITIVALVIMFYRVGAFDFLKVAVLSHGSASGFSTLPQPFLTALEQIGRKIELKANDSLFREGDSGDSLFVVLTGKINIVKTIDGKIGILESYGRGELVGEGAFLSGMPRTAGGVAKEKTSVLKIDRASLEKLPQLAQIMETIWRLFSWHRFDNALRGDPLWSKKMSAQKRQHWFAHGVMKNLPMKAELSVPESHSHVFLVSGRANIGGIEFNGPTLVPFTTGRTIYAERVVHMVVLPDLEPQARTTLKSAA